MVEENLDKQLELELSEPWSNRYWKYRKRLSKKLQRLENYRFYRQTAIWLLLALIFLLNALIYDYYLVIREDLPSLVPFLNNYIRLQPRLTNQIQISYIPATSIAITAVLTITSIKLFNRKPFYSILILMILSISLAGMVINLVNLTSQYI